MAQLQHWSVICTTCDSPAQYHCNTCGDILCPRCKDIHQRSRGTGHHYIVFYSERVEPGQLTGQCEDHPGHQCILWCQRCDKATCTECVTATNHEGHKFVKIAWKLEDQRKVLREEIDKYSNLLKQWEGALQKHQSSMKDYDNDVDDLSKEISKTADKVCQQVRSIEAALQTQLQDMKTVQTSKLIDQKQILLKEIARIKQQIKGAEDKLRSEDVRSLLCYKSKEDNIESEKPPKKDPPTLPKFTPGKLDTQSLENVLGHLSMISSGKYCEKRAVESSKWDPLTVPTATTYKGHQTASHISNSNLCKMSLLHVSVATAIPNIQLERIAPPHLACAGSGQAWMRTGREKIQLIDKQGTVKKTINENVIIGGMTTAQNGELLITMYNDHSIKSISEDGNIQTLFHTKWRPYGACRLHNGDIMVVFYEDGRVVQYSTTGKVVRELDKSIFRYPRNVAQNKINGQIYVCDKSGDFLDTPGRLLAFNMMTGKLKYDYTGSDAATFTPWDVCTDQAGHVIITDWGNDLVHILDQDGRFLQYMLTKDQGLSKPYCIDTDTEGYAWISEWDIGSFGRVKTLRYMK